MMRRNPLGLGLCAAAGVVALLAVCISGCGTAATADQLAAEAVRSISEANQLTFQGSTHTSVNGYKLPSSPSFAGQLISGKELVLAVRPTSAAAGNSGSPAKAAFTRESAGTWKAVVGDGGGGIALLTSNPLPWLEQIPLSKRQTVFDAKLSDTSTRAIKVTLDPSEVRRLVVSELQREREQAQAFADTEQSKTPHGLTAKQAAARRSELVQTAANAVAKLDRMVATLETEGDLTLWLDRAGNRAAKAALDATLRYQSEGRNVEEHSSTDFTFGDAKNDSLLPSSKDI